MAKKQTKRTNKKSVKSDATKKKQIRKSSNKKAVNTDKSILFELKLIILFFMSVAIAFSVHGFPMGIVGEAVRDVLSGLFSVSMYFIPYFFMAWILVLSISKFREKKARYLFSLLALFLAQGFFVGFYTREFALPVSFSNLTPVYLNGTKFIGAGLIGNSIFYPLYSLLGEYGIILLIVVLCIVFLLLASKFTFSGMMVFFGKSIKKTGEKALENSKKIGENINIQSQNKEAKPEANEQNEELFEEDIYDGYKDFSPLREAFGRKKTRFSKDDIDLEDEELLEKIGGVDDFEYPELEVANQVVDVKVPAESTFVTDNDLESESENTFKFIDIVVEDNEVDNEEKETVPVLSSDHLERSPLCHPERNEQSECSRTDLTPDNIDNPHPVIDEDYILPSFEILMKGVSGSSSENELDMVNKSAILEETFKSFKVDADVVSSVRGPMITRFEVKPKAGVKISKIASLSDDIAMRLAATNVRILAPIPGKSAVGIEVPNDSVSVVRLRDVLESKAYSKQESKIKFGLGKDISGEEIVPDLAKMPHLLIAGATGSGKSVCVNTIISSILFNAKPSEVKFLMIDPKVVELSVYNGIPHLLLPVVTDPSKASIALNWAVNEMTQRYAKFAEYRVRDINSYNEKYHEWKKEQEELKQAEEDIKEHGILAEDVDDHNQTITEDENVVYKVKDEEYQEETMEFMPRIVIIIDELADLMVVAGKQVEEAIARIAQMARAAGMHLIVATQRPSVDVITGLIKANIPSRIAFAVSSQIDSRTILDEQGADKLLGKGDMLFLNAGKSKPIRVQGAFVTDNEVEALVSYVKNQFDGELEYNEDVVDASNVQALSASSNEDSDELLDAAIQFVIQSEKASTSMIQRKFRIGYNRAARMIEEMEDRGIVGESRGAKPREVLISSTLWESENNDA